MLIRMHCWLNLRNERGQSLLLIAGAFIALLMLVGLVTDVALIYVNNGHLRQAVDAAAVAAVNQYREERSIDEIYASAVEFLQLQLPAGLYNAEVYWCAQEDQGYQRLNYLGESTGNAAEVYTPHDDALCTVPPRKRVRVEAWLDADLVFLPLLGLKQVRLFAQAESEAAVVNLVLLLDTSESMAYGVDSDGDGDVDEDPHACPPQSSAYPRMAGGAMRNSFFECLEACSNERWCSPFEEVRGAAVRFLDHMREGIDQAAVYHFDKTPVLTATASVGCDLLGQDPDDYCDPCLVNNPTTTLPIPVSSGMVVPLTTTQQTIREALNDNSRLHVYVRPRVPAPCEHLHTGGYQWQSTNVGGGLREAIMELVRNGERDIAVWVIVLLGDGAANAADWETTGWWACPPAPYDTRYVKPRCRDAEATDADPTRPLTSTVTRHCPSPGDCGRPWYTEPFEARKYDADDYARDMADLASSYQIAVYTIGFGDVVINYPHGRADAGERLLRYIADVGDDGDIHTAPCGSDFYWDNRYIWPLPDRGEQCGNYYYAPDPNELDRVFESIASRVFTRITR